MTENNNYVMQMALHNNNYATQLAQHKNKMPRNDF